MRDNQGSNTMRDATFSRRDMLWAGGALTVAAAFAEPLRAAAAEPSGAGREPTSWVDPAMPEVTHRMIETNGIRLHVAEQGEGPLVILCHGFPECWYSWRHQLPALAKAGFRAVAPDLRGYGRSDRPEEVEKYTILHDICDIVGLVDALGAGLVPRKGALLTDPASLPPWITETDIEVYVAELTRSGFRGPLNWWRNIDRSWELMAAFDGAAVTVPALYIAGDRDMHRGRQGL